LLSTHLRGRKKILSRLAKQSNFRKH
jgi:hypothetical protein